MCIFKGIEESLPAFEIHINEEISKYGALTLINLVEKNGKERALEEAYRKSVLSYNSENITYVTFDFHDKWYANSVITTKIKYSGDRINA